MYHSNPPSQPAASKNRRLPWRIIPLSSAVRRRLSARLSWRLSRSNHVRLTICSQFFPPDFAATGQLLHDLSERLARKGLQVQVLTGQPAYAFNRADAERIEFLPNLCVRRTRVSRLWPKRIRGRAVNGLLFCIRVFVRLLRFSRRGDLMLYTTEPPYLPILGWMVHRLTGTPYILVLYDLYPDVLEELKVLSSGHPLVRVWRRLNSLAVRNAKEVIVLSHAMTVRVRRHCPEIGDRLAVVPSWANPYAIRPREREANPFARRHGLEGKFVVLYSGNQGRCHDLVTLLAAALLLRHEPDVQFLFIGGGPQNDRLRELVADWGLTNCRFLPYQEPSVLPYSLSCADVAVVSLGIDAEGLVAPSKLYGHLAAGTPIAAITPRGSALQELVLNSGCGAWFANGDAETLAAWIRRLRDHPEEARRYGDAARNLLFASASPERVTRQYMALIQRHLPADKALHPLPLQTRSDDRRDDDRRSGHDPVAALMAGQERRQLQRRLGERRFPNDRLR